MTSTLKEVIKFKGYPQMETEELLEERKKYEEMGLDREVEAIDVVLRVKNGQIEYWDGDVEYPSTDSEDWDNSFSYSGTVKDSSNINQNEELKNKIRKKFLNKRKRK